MKRISLLALLLATLLLVSLAAPALAIVPPGEITFQANTYVKIGDETATIRGTPVHAWHMAYEFGAQNPVNVDILAGQHTVVGSVNIRYAANKAYITYNMNAGVQFEEVHFAVFDDDRINRSYKWAPGQIVKNKANLAKNITQGVPAVIPVKDGKFVVYLHFGGVGTLGPSTQMPSSFFVKLHAPTVSPDVVREISSSGATTVNWLPHGVYSFSLVADLAGNPLPASYPYTATFNPETVTINYDQESAIVNVTFAQK